MAVQHSKIKKGLHDMCHTDGNQKQHGRKDIVHCMSLQYSIPMSLECSFEQQVKIAYWH